MVEPAFALTVFFVLLLVIAAVAWPRLGLVGRLRASGAWGGRAQLEDALKHLHLRERQGRAASIEDLAGKLEVTTGRAADVLSQLVQARLAVMDAECPTLTVDGRALALQTIRTHRLWERWLADRTGVRAEDWHEQAERMEHALSAEETEALSSRLGHPRYDPHGDPIPTSAGDLPPLPGVALTGIPVGRVARVVHLEDEPPEIFSKLLKRGLALGLDLEIVRSSDQGGVVIRTPDGDRSLDPVAAGHVSVELLPEGTRIAGRRRSLAEVAVGESVRVTGLSPACQGPQRRRLLDLGLVRGGTVTPELVSTTRDPIAYRILGALIALRREQASWVSVAEADSPELVGASGSATVLEN